MNIANAFSHCETVRQARGFQGGSNVRKDRNQAAVEEAFAPSRRNVLQGFGAAGLAAGFAIPAFRRASAQDAVTLRWWSTQSAPAQLAAYEAQIAAFEAANPGVKVVFEPTSDEGYSAQLAAAFASKQVPDIITHLPSFAVQTYYAEGLVEPFDDVIQTIGADKYYAGR